MLPVLRVHEHFPLGIVRLAARLERLGADPPTTGLDRHTDEAACREQPVELGVDDDCGPLRERAAYRDEDVVDAEVAALERDGDGPGDAVLRLLRRPRAACEEPGQRSATAD